MQDTYDGGYYTKEESDKNGCVVFTIKKKIINLTISRNNNHIKLFYNKNIY